MAQQRYQKIAYAKTRLTQQERVETDLKRWFYELNGGSTMLPRLNKELRANGKDLQDTEICAQRGW